MSTMRKLTYSLGTALVTGAMVIPAAAAVAAPKPITNPTVHVVEKSGMFNQGTKALQAGPWRVFVKIGTYFRWIPSEDFRQVQQRDGTFKLEYAPNGAHTGLYLFISEREQRGLQHSLRYVSDARLVRGPWFATSLKLGPKGPLGYSLLQTTHHERQGPHWITEQLVAKADAATGKVYLEKVQITPAGYTANELFRLDVQSNPGR